MSAADRSQGNESWLGDSSAVIALVIPIDGEAALLAEGRRFADHPVAMSNQLYEINRGVPRLLKMLHELGIRATFLIPGITIERHPRIVDSVLADGHELAHHSYSHRKPIDLSASEERADFERALAVMERFGIQPVGYRAASWAPSFRTLGYVREYGLLYDNSLMGHDRPYRVSTTSGDLLEIPSHWMMDDLEQYGWLPEPSIGMSIESPQTAVSIWQEELDAMRRYGGLLQLTAHAFLSGRPGRARALGELLGAANRCADVEVLTCEQVARRAAHDPSLELRTYQVVAP
jgi:peptidoglycan-N-acetylglucosamine deacetylase